MNIQEEKDEMRRDMLMEIKLRTDDDFFYEHITDKYSKMLIAYSNECKLFDREPEDWFQLIIEK